MIHRGQDRMKSKGTGGENGKRRGELDRERKQSQNMPFIAVFCPCFFHRGRGPGMAHSWGRAWGWGGDWQADSGLSRGDTPGPSAFAGGSTGGTWACWTAGSHGNEFSSHWAQQRAGLQPCSPGYTGSGHRGSLICLVLSCRAWGGQGGAVGTRHCPYQLCHMCQPIFPGALGGEMRI